MGEAKPELAHLIGWPAAAIIGITILVNELLPVILGTGERAVVDWGSFYVTFRFILLPLACVAHLFANIGLLVFNRRTAMGARLVRFGSVAVSGGFLAISYFCPLPLFQGTW